MSCVLAEIQWGEIMTRDTIIAAVHVAMLAGIGFPFVLFASSLTGRLLKKRVSAQGNMLIRKGILYLGTVIIILAILYQLDFKFTALLGAAGIVGIALGFASQTSVSNIISGIFLISEAPFQVGDIIKVGDVKGTILSVDLLSVKLRTFENQYVRIPNETLLKTQVTNVTRFPIRRLDIELGVAYKEDFKRVKRVLLDIGEKHPLCLDEPEPVVRFANFGDSSLELLFAVWCAKDDYLKLKNEVMEQIKERFDSEGIEIPFPHRTLYTGSVTEPFPVRVVADETSEAS